MLSFQSRNESKLTLVETGIHLHDNITSICTVSPMSRVFWSNHYEYTSLHYTVNLAALFQRNIILFSYYFCFKLGMSNRARSDIRTFASGIRIHPDVRIVYIRPFSHRICHSIL